MKKLLLLLTIAVLVALFVMLGGLELLTFERLKDRQQDLESLWQDRPLATLGGFFVIYVGMAAVSLPGAGILTVAAGLIFGLAVGTLVVSFASALGATLALLGSRYLLQDLVARRLGAKLQAVHAGIAREGAFYLFSLRLIPLIPYFVINLAFGPTRLRAWTFYWVSQVGMLPATLILVNAGTQISRVEALSDVLSPGLLIALALFGTFPLVARRVIAAVRARRASGTVPSEGYHPGS